MVTSGAMRDLIDDLRTVVEETDDEMAYARLISVLLALETGDMVEIRYADKQKGGVATTKRRVSMSWTEFKNQTVRDGSPEMAFHFKFQAKPSVLLDPSSANKAHLNKPGKGGGQLKDYGDEVMFQATVSTPVKRVLGLRRI